MDIKRAQKEFNDMKVLLKKHETHYQLHVRQIKHLTKQNRQLKRDKDRAEAELKTAINELKRVQR